MKLIALALICILLLGLVVEIDNWLRRRHNLPKQKRGYGRLNIGTIKAADIWSLISKADNVIRDTDMNDFPVIQDYWDRLVNRDKPASQMRIGEIGYIQHWRVYDLTVVVRTQKMGSADTLVQMTGDGLQILWIAPDTCEFLMRSTDVSDTDELYEMLESRYYGRRR